MVQTNTQSRNTAFTHLLQRDRPTLLDGGLATQLEAQGADLRHALWSASLLQDDPDSILFAHRAYLEAGAECIASASYQASREGYAQVGVSQRRADELIARSVTLARQACDDAGSSAAIAASLGPYGAMLHDGSEYHGNYGVGAATLRQFHESRLEIMDNSGADVLALETIPSGDEAEILADSLSRCETPSWVSFSCRDGKHISDGTPLLEAATLFVGHPTVVAVGINCTPPQYAVELIAALRTVVPDKHLIVYPNSGEKYDASNGTWNGTVTPVDCARAALTWIDAGATIVGGCCRMGPEHIRAIASLLI